MLFSVFDDGQPECSPLKINPFLWNYISCTGKELGEDGLGLHGLREQEVEVPAENADKDKDFNVTDLDKCKVTM